MPQLLYYGIILTLVNSTVSCGPSLYEAGIPTQGTVLAKSSIDRLKNRDNYYLTVSYFTQPDKENPQPKPKCDSPANIDQIIENIGNIKVNIGDYMSTQVTVRRSVYDSYNVGDQLPLLYEKGNPEHVVVGTKE